jgi:neutral ceramidase
MRRTAVILLLLVLPAHVLAQEAPRWQAGVAKMAITPRHLMWMSGYGARSKPAEGKIHDLWAKALVLQAGERRCVLITADLVGIGRELALAVCTEIEKRHGFARADIMIALSHTHCGPVVGHNLHAMYALDEKQTQLVADYTHDLQENLLSVVAAAVKDLAPAELSRGEGLVTFATNRRNNKADDVPRLRDLGQLRGPVDHQVPVLAVRDLAGKLRAVVFGYACHATVMGFYQWCGDYPGFAQLALEKSHPGALALFWAGCGADQNPLPRQVLSLAELYGQKLADGVDAVLQAPMARVPATLRTTYTEIALPFGDLPSREQLVADSTSKNRYIASRAKLLLGQLEKTGSLRQTYPYPIQVWQLGPDLTWIALGGEVVVDYVLRLRKELGPVWVTAYANDVMAYIPSLRVLKEGGYEGGGAMVYYGLPSAWGPRVEELIVNAVHAQVAKVRPMP